MRKTDISDYTEISEKPSAKHNSVAGSVIKNTFLLIWRTLLTLITILFIACVIIGISMVMYVASIAREPTGIDLHSAKLNETSYIYIYDKNDNPQQYMQLYTSENRVTVDFDDIPDYMKKAIVAIEDKRFYEHHGVDWYRTAGAIFSLSTGGSQFGGSTLTQQLIKNITNDKDVSISRKLKEIFRALNVEREFTKDEILESYLNTVNFGGNNNGIQAAATAYFDKDVKDLTLAQCAAIVGITQNPSRYNPLYFPEYNRERRETVLYAMLEQGKITDSEYKQAMDESAHMTFVDPNNYIEEETEQVDIEQIQNWYIETVFSDLTSDLAEYLDISETAASNKIYTEGLKIYCALDLEVQEQMEKTIKTYPYFAPGAYSDLECGFCMMDYDGKIIAIVGSNKEKQGNLEWNRATDSALQPGSTIKGVAAYPVAINNGNLYYSSIVHDVPMDNWFQDTGAPGPNNWYLSYMGDMLLPDAIEISCNASVANVLRDLVDPNGQDGVRYSYDYVTNKLGWTHLNFEIDSQNMAGLSIGGFNGGTTVREMTKAYTLLGNGGKSYKPYTYYYVTDADDKVIIDNREQDPIQALTEETAAIMNRLLNYNIQTSHSTNAGETRIPGWDIIGKTGTTDADQNSWFCGCSPYCAAAIWTGYDTPATVPDTTISTKLWKVLMEQYLQGKEHKEYVFPNDLIVAQYCPYTGLLANTGCGAGHYGYYNKSNLPEYCTYHSGFNTEYTTWGDLNAANQQNTVSEQAVNSKADFYYDYYNEDDYYYQNNNNNNNNNHDNTQSIDEDGGYYDNNNGDYDYDNDGGSVDPGIEEPSVPDPVVPDPAAPDPVVPDPVAPDPVVPDPAAPDPVAPDPTAPDAGAE
ncbi:MAG: transglycosylase domain-containing protein [Acutalibacteraceae bacterium]|nr:transglycosylase domain-containing protein [Acutalibacteraceae bacterium]